MKENDLYQPGLVSKRLPKIKAFLQWIANDLGTFLQCERKTCHHRCQAENFGTYM